MWTKLKGYQAFLLCMWNKCFLHCGLHKLMLTCWINTAVNYTLIDCKDFFSTAAILRFDSDSKEELNVWAFLVENPPAMREAWVWSLGWEIPWRKIWQPTPVLLPGESPWTEEPGGLQSMGSQRVRLDWVTKYIKLESRLLGEISITSDMQMTPHLWQKVKKN